MYMLYVCKNVYDLFLNRLLYFEFWMLNAAHVSVMFQVFSIAAF